MEFTEQRNKELMRAYREAIHQSEFIDIAEISEKIVSMPCSRFWVSEERAVVVVAAMMKGKPVLNAMRPTKREMFKEIHRRVIQLRKERHDASLFDLVMKVVNSPAPKFYMTKRSAMETIYKIKKGFYSKRKPKESKPNTSQSQAKHKENINRSSRQTPDASQDRH